MRRTNSIVTTFHAFLKSPVQALIQLVLNDLAEASFVAYESTLDHRCLLRVEVGKANIRRVNDFVEAFSRVTSIAEMLKVEEQDMKSIPDFRTGDEIGESEDLGFHDRRTLW